MVEIRRIRNVDDTEASYVATDCPSCGKEIKTELMNLRIPIECCNHIFQLEPAIELVVYRKDD